jgi:hypothetical protein
VAGINAEAQRDVDRLIEFGELQLLDQGNSVETFCAMYVYFPC